MSALESEAKEAISTRLQRATAELRELDRLMRSTDIDRRVLEQFCEALDTVRLTAWGLRSH